MTEKKYVSNIFFNHWVNTMINQCIECKEAISKYNNGITYIYLRSKVGKAKCHPDDEKNADIGLAYAWARCTGQPEYYNEDDLIENVNKSNPNKKGYYVYLKLKDRKDRLILRFIAEGTNNYCFRDTMGNLKLYDKKDIKYIKPYK